MSEFVDNHPLGRDLPEYKYEIHKLKMHDAHFAKQMERYEEIDKEIVRNEQGLEHMDDLHLDGLKMQRVQLKDELVEMLRQAAS
ncbi:MAG: GTP-binding protein [Gammaproteobacteria bacterium]|nr:MAG: GTP-binding protein [Gammaproteobacteria bacterium]